MKNKCVDKTYIYIKNSDKKNFDIAEDNNIKKGNKIKKTKKNKISGAKAFEQYYQNVFGERWQNLKMSLLLPAKSFEWN